MSATWWAVVVGSALCYGLKLLGYAVPRRALDNKSLRTLVETFPIALLAALLAVVTLAEGTSLTVDARLAGLGVAALALYLRAPFLLVVASAAITAALLRALGSGV